MKEHGTIKWFDRAKGVGLIGRERGKDVFVHHAAVVAEGFRALNEGDRVAFDVVDGPKGLQARNVIPAGKAVRPGGGPTIGPPASTRNVGLPELHDPETGCLDARKIADFLKVPLKQFSEALGKSYSAVHKTPAARSLQPALQPVKSILNILNDLYPNRSAALAWLNNPHPDLGRHTPLDVILQGHPNAVKNLLEAALMGTPP